MNLVLITLALGIIIGMAIAGHAALRSKRQADERIRKLSTYLEQAVAGQAPILEQSGEDDISQLQDEITKTVTALEQSRKRAVQQRDSFAENLANIAHQIKTPIAAMSLAIQGSPDCADVDAIGRQLARLDQLQKDLLVMARLDSGSLAMEPGNCDAYSLLSMSADNLEELSRQRGVTIDIDEDDPVTFLADSHWTCEALSNIIKNCIEHSPEGSTVRASYADNPLYVEIRISDEGPGFSDEDLAHLFERFCQGGKAASGATGLGLFFARQLVEMQNGTLRAENLPDGGATFEIRFYRHPIVTL